MAEIHASDIVCEIKARFTANGIDRLDLKKKKLK